MNQYTLEELLEDLTTPYQESGKKVYLSAPRDQHDAVKGLAGDWSTFTPAERLVPWDENGRDIDRFDLICGTHREQTWWIPGHTKTQHQMYTTLRADGMGIAEAVNTVEVLEALEPA